MNPLQVLWENLAHTVSYSGCETKEGLTIYTYLYLYLSTLRFFSAMTTSCRMLRHFLSQNHSALFFTNLALSTVRLFLHQ